MRTGRRNKHNRKIEEDRKRKLGKKGEKRNVIAKMKKIFLLRHASCEQDTEGVTIISNNPAVIPIKITLPSNLPNSWQGDA